MRSRFTTILWVTIGVIGFPLELVRPFLRGRFQDYEPRLWMLALVGAVATLGFNRVFRGKFLPGRTDKNVPK